MMTRTQLQNDRHRAARIHLLGCLVITCLALWPAAVGAHDFPALDEAIPGPEAFPGPSVAELAPVFDFDTDRCLPSAGISRDGQTNGGLEPTGSLTGQCRSTNFLETSNTIHRYQCEENADGEIFCAHVFGLYFEKDQRTAGAWGVSGHRHDWEMAVVWTTNGEITHGSVSAHGGLSTRSRDDLPLYFEGPGDEVGQMMVVYHKDGTGAFRFAKSVEESGAEGPENPYDEWVTPPITSWYELDGDRLSNYEMRGLLDGRFWGGTNMPAREDYFYDKIRGNRPEGYPYFPTRPAIKPLVRVAANGTALEFPVLPAGTQVLNGGSVTAVFPGDFHMAAAEFPSEVTVTEEEGYASVRVEPGATIEFDASATDPTGIGYPIYESEGDDEIISYLWDFDGATVSDPLSQTAESVVVTFDLPPGEESWIYDLTVTSFNSRGEPGTTHVVVGVAEERDVVVRADGDYVSNALVVRSGTTVQFEAVDQDGGGTCYEHYLSAEGLDQSEYGDDFILLLYVYRYFMDYSWSVEGDCSGCRVALPSFEYYQPMSVHHGQVCDFEPGPWQVAVYCAGGACDASVPVTFELAPDEGPRTVDVNLYVADDFIPTELSVQVHVTDDPTACVGADADFDGIPDCRDNCIQVPNGPALATGWCDSQEDSDGDGYGNPCDLDFNGDGATGADDLSLMLAGLNDPTKSHLDINCDGAPGADDLVQVLNRQLEVPGPSAYRPD